MPFITQNSYGQIEIISFEEAWARNEERKRHRKAAFDGEYLTVYVGSSFTYDIEAERIQSPQAALDWVHQLSQKTWAWEDPQIMEDFLEVLFETIPTSYWSGCV